MEILKKFWPLARIVKKGEVVSLVLGIVIHLVACALVGWITASALNLVPIVGSLSGITGLAFDLYGVVGIVLCVLKFVGKF